MTKTTTKKSSKKFVTSFALAGALLVGSGAGAFAAEAGFLNKFKQTLFGVNTQVAENAATKVAKGNAEAELSAHIDSEADRIAREIISKYNSKVKEGNDSVAAHKEQLKQQVTNLSNEVINDANTKINNEVDKKVDAIEAELDKAVDNKITSELKEAGIISNNGQGVGNGNGKN